MSAPFITIVTSRLPSGQFEAQNGNLARWGQSATVAARTLGAELLGVEPSRVEIEAVGPRVLRASVRPAVVDRAQLFWWIVCPLVCGAALCVAWWVCVGGAR